MEFDGVHWLLIGNIMFGALIILGVLGFVLAHEVPGLYNLLRHAVEARFARLPEHVPVPTALTV